MGKNKTTEQFKKEVYNLVGDEYTVLGEYINNHTKIKMKHNICNCEYEVTPSHFLNNGSRCPKCAKLLKKTTELFKQEVFDLVGNEYTVLGTYINTRTKIEIEHNLCGYKYNVKPHSFLDGSRCPKCAGTQQKTTNQFKQEVFELVGDEYSILGEYVNSYTSIKIKHNICNQEYKGKPSDFLSGHRCPSCFKNHKKTTEQFKQEVFALFNNEYSILEPYINAKTTIKVKHNKCNHEYKTFPNNLLHGHGCPKCNESKGEKQISELLNNHKIKFISQYKINECKDINSLPFDFGILNLNNDLMLLIEYDGNDHYYPINRGNWTETELIEQFKNRKRKDKIKTDYCKQKNIPLLRIPYWEFNNINKIVIKKLYRLGLI